MQVVGKESEGLCLNTGFLLCLVFVCTLWGAYHGVLRVQWPSPATKMSRSWGLCGGTQMPCFPLLPACGWRQWVGLGGRAVLAVCCAETVHEWGLLDAQLKQLSIG